MATIISAEHIDRLYWLGRYSERVYTTIRIFADQFDSMIDLKKEEYEEFCRKQDIPNIYESRDDFAQRYCFDEENPNSIFSNLMRAYDNAIVLREEIGSETLAFIQMAVYAMNKGKLSEAPMIQLQRVTDNLMAFWGIVDDDIDNGNVRNILKSGKRLERIDLYARMHMDQDRIRREMDRLNLTINRTNLKYNPVKMAHLNYLVEIKKPDYDLIVEELESLFELEENA